MLPSMPGKKTPNRELAAAAQSRLPGIPLDWFDTTTPERWRLENQPTQFDWYEGD
jgi:hypothetical protein